MIREWLKNPLLSLFSWKPLFIMVIVAVVICLLSYWLYEENEPIPVDMDLKKGTQQHTGPIPEFYPFVKELQKALTEVTDLQFTEDGTPVKVGSQWNKPHSYVFYAEPWIDDWPHDPYYFEVPNGDPDVIDEFNEGLKTLLQNGEYAKIYKKHFGDDNKYRVFWCKDEGEPVAVANAEKSRACQEEWEQTGEAALNEFYWCCPRLFFPNLQSHYGHNASDGNN